MKLLFRPDPFKDENDEEIELEDIEIEYIKGEGCTEDNCGYATLEISLVRTDGPNSYISFEFSDEEDIQNEVEKIWNGGISVPVEVFKRKENKFEKLYKTKQTVDLGKLTWPNSDVHPALEEIINEEDINAPISTSYEDIVEFVKKKREEDEEMLS